MLCMRHCRCCCFSPLLFAVAVAVAVPSSWSLDQRAWVRVSSLCFVFATGVTLIMLVVRSRGQGQGSGQGQGRRPSTCSASAKRSFSLRSDAPGDRGVAVSMFMCFHQFLCCVGNDLRLLFSVGSVWALLSSSVRWFTLLVPSLSAAASKL